MRLQVKVGRRGCVYKPTITLGCAAKRNIKVGIVVGVVHQGVVVPALAHDEGAVTVKLRLSSKKKQDPV